MNSISSLRHRILIVDDSAFVRKVVREILAQVPSFEIVGSARDGGEALHSVEDLRPDLVICDLHMPNLNGVEFVRRQMAVKPLPILILSSAAQDAAEVVEALNAGALDVVRKPTALATDGLRVVGEELIEKVHEALRTSASNLARPLMPPLTAERTDPARRLRADIVVVGISTGGPQALRRMLPLLPANFPVPIAIVLHMPIGYTALYAEKLNELCVLNVREAADGDLLRPGLALVAPAGRHLTFHRESGGGVVAQLALQPLEKIHRPSVDVLFRSAAEIYGERVLAVVMTGMGADGTEGAAFVKAAGGTVITEAEKSCVIYGMPRSIDEAGLSDSSVPLEEMAKAIVTNL